jgi:hypothetical protein
MNVFLADRDREKASEFTGLFAYSSTMKMERYFSETPGPPRTRRRYNPDDHALWKHKGLLESNVVSKDFEVFTF